MLIVLVQVYVHKWINISFLQHKIRGNFGVRDQQVAIEWVFRNIADFGGDPSRINIFGCSAGGRSVGAQLVTPYNDGIIFSAIGQSGDISSDLIWDNFAEDNLRAVLENTNCAEAASHLDCLRNVEIDSLQRAADSSKEGFDQFLHKNSISLLEHYTRIFHKNYSYT